MDGLIVVVALGVVGWSYTRGVVHICQRSREELACNIAWIKHALQRPTPVTSRQPQDR